MARPTKRRAKAQAPVSQREKEVERDVFEAEDSDPEEERLKNKYDNVESYEYELPSDFEDEEIDEDTAFTAEDEELYGHLFAKKDNNGGSEEDEEDYSDEERPSNENNPLLDSEEDVSGSEDDELDDVFSSSAEEEDEDEEGGTRAEEDAAAHAALLAAVTGGLKKRREGRAGKAAVTEAYPESEHGLPSAEGLSVADLMAGLGTSQAALGAARKALTRMEEKQKTVEPPLPGPIKARLERKAGYEHAREDVSKWQSLVNANRNAPTLRFIGERGPGQESASLPALIAQHAPSTSMEEEVAALLNAAGAHSAKALSEAEEKLTARSLSAEDARERRDRLAKMRALLYYHEVKAKRLKKIKSKEYRRHLRRAEMRKAKKLGVLTTDEDGVDTIRVDRESAEFDRMRERLTLKHKNTSSWARRAIRRGLAHQDADTRAAIAEQLRRGQELTRKAERHGSDDDDQDEDVSTSASESESEDAADQATRARNKARAAALEVLRGAETKEAPTQGLLALPFMKRALEKRKQAAVHEARQALAEDDDAENGGLNAASSNGRRMSFSGEGSALKSAVPVVKDDDDMASDSELEADERETVEEKRQRLARSIAEERAERAERAAQAAADAAKSAAKHETGSSNRQTESSSLGPPPKSHASNGFVSAAPVSGRKAKATNKQQSDGAPKDNNNTLVAFQPAKKFGGARAGYVFKKGPKGLGYYPDRQASTRPKGDGKPESKKKTAATGKKRDRAGDTETLPNTTNAANSRSNKKPKEELAASSKSMAPAKSTATSNKDLLSQDDLIRMAFAGDDVVAEFAAEKAAEVEGELPKVEEIGVLPGWGAWSGAQKEPAWMAEARRKSAQKREEAAAARKDAKMQFVVLSEKWDKKAAKYRTSTVPFPYDSKQTYERARRQPLGREFNTDEAFRDLTRPAILKDSGVVIQPLRYSEGAAAIAKNLPRRAARNPVNTVQAGRLKSTARAK